MFYAANNVRRFALHTTSGDCRIVSRFCQGLFDSGWAIPPADSQDSHCYITLSRLLRFRLPRVLSMPSIW